MNGRVDERSKAGCFGLSRYYSIIVVMVKNQRPNYIAQVIWGIVLALATPFLAWTVLLPMLLMGFDNRYTQLPSLLLYFAVTTFISGRIFKGQRSKHPYIHGFAIIGVATWFAGDFTHPTKRIIALLCILLVAAVVPFVVRLIPEITLPMKSKKIKNFELRERKRLQAFKRFATTGQNWVLVVFIAVPLLYGTSYVLNQINLSQDATRFYQLQRDMKDLHKKALILDSNARYYEHCSADHGLYAADIPTDCSFSIGIDGAKYSRDFEKIIDETPYFTFGTFTYESDSQIKNHPRWLKASVDHDRLSAEICTYSLSLSDDVISMSCKIPAAVFYIGQPDRR